MKISPGPATANEPGRFLRSWIGHGQPIFPALHAFVDGRDLFSIGVQKFIHDPETIGAAKALSRLGNDILPRAIVFAHSKNLMMGTEAGFARLRRPHCYAAFWCVIWFSFDAI